MLISPKPVSAAGRRRAAGFLDEDPSEPVTTDLWFPRRVTPPPGFSAGPAGTEIFSLHPDRHHRERLEKFTDLPDVGAAIARAHKSIGDHHPADLIGRDPLDPYFKLCRHHSRRRDPCAVDVFLSIERFLAGNKGLRCGRDAAAGDPQIVMLPTVASMATSAPELFVSPISTMQGNLVRLAPMTWLRATSWPSADGP